VQVGSVAQLFYQPSGISTKPPQSYRASNLSNHLDETLRPASN